MSVVAMFVSGFFFAAGFLIGPHYLIGSGIAFAVSLILEANGK